MLIELSLNEVRALTHTHADTHNKCVQTKQLLLGCVVKSLTCNHYGFSMFWENQILHAQHGKGKRSHPRLGVEWWTVCLLNLHGTRASSINFRMPKIRCLCVLCLSRRETTENPSLSFVAGHCSSDVVW